MGFILEKIEEAIKELLIGWIESNMTNMFTDVNDKVGTIAAEVGKTPSSWDSSISSTTSPPGWMRCPALSLSISWQSWIVAAMK